MAALKLIDYSSDDDAAAPAPVPATNHDGAAAVALMDVVGGKVQAA